ncbi:hypothetical protein D9M68_636150 [compost metagenome]
MYASIIRTGKSAGFLGEVRKVRTASLLNRSGENSFPNDRPRCWKLSTISSASNMVLLPALLSPTKIFTSSLNSNV